MSASEKFTNVLKDWRVLKHESRAQRYGTKNDVVRLPWRPLMAARLQHSRPVSKPRPAVSTRPHAAGCHDFKARLPLVGQVFLRPDSRRQGQTAVRQIAD